MPSDEQERRQPSTRPSNLRRRAVLGLTAGALSVAGCLGGSNGGSTTDAPTTTPDEPTTEPAETTAPPTSTREPRRTTVGASCPSPPFTYEGYSVEGGDDVPGIRVAAPAFTEVTARGAVAFEIAGPGEPTNVSVQPFQRGDSVDAMAADIGDDLTETTARFELAVEDARSFTDAPDAPTRTKVLLPTDGGAVSALVSLLGGDPGCPEAERAVHQQLVETVRPA